MIPDPPSDSSVLHWIAWVIIVAFVGIGGLIFNRLGGRKEYPDSHINVPTRDGQPDASINTRGMSPDVAAGFAALAVSQKAVMDENVQLEARITMLETDNAELRTERAQLVADMVKLRNGVLDGTIPPLPEIAKSIRHLFPGI